ncbi:MAG: BON domain-containing protein [Thermoanaerobaculia bacterium]|nr:BON domain-containing protein [Thermoanaerobaculia bacterium]
MRRDNVLIGITGVAVGASLGAAIMYLLDPDRGNRRRAKVKDRLDRITNETSETVRSRASDLRNRTRGAIHEVRRKVTSEEEPSESTLEARVRSALGRTVSNPSSIVVTAHDQRVTLSGPVLDDEVEDLVDAVRSIPGVRDVRNLLQVHEKAESVPGLQGG